MCATMLGSASLVLIYLPGKVRKPPDVTVCSSGQVGGGGGGYEAFCSGKERASGAQDIVTSKGTARPLP
jgi:hypothetical protein